ncbi:MAG TPA: DUF4105 domain-containing protein [Bacteroidetes bacterium]|nr:DUF4105 domain-containing protein [Bacteroidota bacterium]HIL58070.1 DUF4105 domain-containing protein [Rhodothermales bacterium]
MRPLVLLALLAAAASAQPAGLDSLLTAPGAPALSDDARVSLLTMLPGEEVYSLWGHSSLRIHDPASGLDRTYNYGTFDFEQPGFILRFVRGHLDYMLDTAPFDLEVAKYEFLQRPMIEQTLDLPPETTRELFRALEENALPENRAYRYDFIWDNCSTRLLDMVDAALVATGHPATTLPPAEWERTYREMLGPYTENHPWLDFGTNLGLGLPTDAVAQPDDQTFLPLALMEIADGATVGGRPLVAARDTVFWVPQTADARAMPWPAILGWLLLAAAVGGTIWMRQRLRSDRLRRFGARLDGLLFGLAGLAGLILVLMWVATDHRVTAANVELLWLWPTHLVAAFWLSGLRPGTAWRRYALAAAVGTALVVALWWAWPEPMHPAGIPLALLLAFRAAMRSRLPG